MVRWRTSHSLINHLRVARFGFVEPEPGLHVLFGRDLEVDGFALDMALVQMPQEWHAPLAPRPRAETLADERRHGRILACKKALDLSQGDMEAQADFVVVVHARILRRAREWRGLVRAIAQHQLPESHIVPLSKLVPGVLEGADEREPQRLV